MVAGSIIDRSRLDHIGRRERQAFADAQPRSLELWRRARGSMPNGVATSPSGTARQFGQRRTVPSLRRKAS